MIRNYPKVGSRWSIIACPKCQRGIYEVISSGHGSVVLKHIESDHHIKTDILYWEKGYYSQIKIE